MLAETLEVEYFATGSGLHMLLTKGIDVVSGKVICARTASALVILPENAQMILCATTVDKLDIWQLIATRRQCVGTAKSQDIYLQNVRSSQFVILVGRWGTWLVNVPSQATLEFAAIVSSQAIWQPIASMRRPVTSAGSLATLLGTALMSPFAISATLMDMWPVNALTRCFLHPLQHHQCLGGHCLSLARCLEGHLMISSAVTVVAQAIQVINAFTWSCVALAVVVVTVHWSALLAQSLIWSIVDFESSITKLVMVNLHELSYFPTRKIYRYSDVNSVLFE